MRCPGSSGASLFITFSAIHHGTAACSAHSSSLSALERESHGLPGQGEAFYRPVKDEIRVEI